MKKNTGIVLRVSTKHRPHIVIMDDKEGKITTQMRGDALRVGSLITYSAHRKNIWWDITSIELLDMPCALAKHDILFLHHLLELCYYCLPIGSCARDLVSFFHALYQCDPNFSRITQKSIIFKLLVMLGVYPEEMVLYVKRFHNIAQESIDTVSQAILNLGIEQELDQWLKSCIMSHPHARYFKTLSWYQWIH
ncbi:hypothetical protein KJZ61_00445 [Candidatus Dependentiae bacterium]|nr:hypothetical protein [Candidatus Dependentiae bacterium]